MCPETGNTEEKNKSQQWEEHLPPPATADEVLQRVYLIRL